MNYGKNGLNRIHVFIIENNPFFTGTPFASPSGCSLEGWIEPV
jgi:hypothetical protein